MIRVLVTAERTIRGGLCKDRWVNRCRKNDAHIGGGINDPKDVAVDRNATILASRIRSKVARVTVVQ